MKKTEKARNENQNSSWSPAQKTNTIFSTLGGLLGEM